MLLKENNEYAHVYTYICACVFEGERVDMHVCKGVMSSCVYVYAWKRDIMCERKSEYVCECIMKSDQYIYEGEKMSA